MDAIDEKIIAELTRNARLSHSEMAGKVLLSRNAVRQRIERLEGHIADYTIVRPGEDTGNAVSALVLVYRQDRMRGGDCPGRTQEHSGGRHLRDPQRRLRHFRRVGLREVRAC
ncbi:AsnC family transcriptional regulator [Streptomyces stelliscabiei]|uniref:AsnC family transcriptional regulator n=1 Tax=Streptomyces stelliscabiei TaxID=146820 RepID=UPI002FF28D11